MIKSILPLLMVIPLLGKGQNTFNVSYGENRLESIPEIYDSDIYRFEGEMGDRVWIRVADAASQIDASFNLKKDDVLLHSEQGTGGDVELFDFTLPESGTYDIEVFDKGKNDVGAYGFSLQKLNNPSYARQIVCGDDIFDEITTQAGVKVYQFDVQQGDLAFAQMRANSDHFEATMYLINEQGDLLRTSVRNANAYASITAHQIANSQKYSLFVFDANGNDLAKFGLTYQDLNDPSCGTQMLQCTDHVANKIAQLAETHAYRFDLNEGQGFVAKAKASNSSFEAVVDVYNPIGHQLFHQRVSGKATDIVIPTVAMTGTYLIVVNDDRANDTSSYHLSYNLLDPACAQELATCHTVEGVLEHPTDINLYYFHMPEQINGMIIKEIDKVIELFTSTINGGDYTNLKDNVKINIKPPIAEPGAIIYFAVSDNGGNDLGAYKIDFTQSDDIPVLSAPVALCKENLIFTIPASGHVELTANEINDNSYDDCQIVQMNVSPNLFDCTQLGDQEVVLEVIDNDGLISTCTTQIKIVTNLTLAVDECLKISVEDFNEEGCVQIEATASGGSGEYSFIWSNGETAPLAQICPNDVGNLSCEVYDANGCSIKREKIWVPIGANVLCHSNGKKVSICHIPTGNPEEKHTLCVSINSLKAHFGHEDYVGPCNGGGSCGQDTEVLLKSLENGSLLISGLVAAPGDYLRIDLQKQVQFENTPVDLTLVDALGRTLYQESAVASSIKYLELQLPSSGLSSGLYYLFLRTMDGSAKQITAPILIK
jgi:hypothetical protein